jgi:hypothetical protein
MSGKLLKRSKSNSRRRNNRILRNRKKTNLASQPVLSRIPADEEGSGRKRGALRAGTCPNCLNSGTFCRRETSDGPAFFHYCTCTIGTDLLARAIGALKRDHEETAALVTGTIKCWRP